MASIAKQQNAPPTVPPESEATASPSNPVATTPRESYERHASTTSHSTEGRIDVEKQQDASGMPRAKQVQSNTESIYPPGKQVAVVMIALLLAMFLIALDRTIITTAIPAMTDEFHSLDDIGWYGR